MMIPNNDPNFFNNRGESNSVDALCKNAIFLYYFPTPWLYFRLKMRAVKKQFLEIFFIY